MALVYKMVDGKITATSAVILGDMGKVVSEGPKDADKIKTSAPHFEDGALLT